MQSLAQRRNRQQRYSVQKTFTVTFPWFGEANTRPVGVTAPKQHLPFRSHGLHSRNEKSVDTFTCRARQSHSERDGRKQVRWFLYLQYHAQHPNTHVTKKKQKQKRAHTLPPALQATTIVGKIRGRSPSWSLERPNTTKSMSEFQQTRRYCDAVLIRPSMRYVFPSRSPVTRSQHVLNARVGIPLRGLVPQHNLSLKRIEATHLIILQGLIHQGTINAARVKQRTESANGYSHSSAPVHAVRDLRYMRQIAQIYSIAYTLKY